MTATSLSLLELNEQIREEISISFAEALWIRAEISELHENASGHTYLELIEKNPESEHIVARNRAVCWANVYRIIKPYFESITGEKLRKGLKIMILCSVEFHELYGFSLNMRDIEPAFTLGDLALQRMEILRRLEADGVMEMNRALPLGDTPRRIAIVSAATAAGYGDFIHQLENNDGGFAFYTKLFPAIMQGENAAKSVIMALDRIFAHSRFFDAVAIIRGGGASVELSCFDNYELALNCAQFPLPIVTGIGHERDESVIDLVAHTRCKTPTAAAEFFIQNLQNAAGRLQHLQQRIAGRAADCLNSENSRMQRLQIRFPHAVNSFIFAQRNALDIFGQKINGKSREGIKTASHRLDLLQQSVLLSSPEQLLKRGFTFTSKNGKIVRRASELQAGEHITTHFPDGKIESRVEASIP